MQMVSVRLPWTWLGTTPALIRLIHPCALSSPVVSSHAVSTFAPASARMHLLATRRADSASRPMGGTITPARAAAGGVLCRSTSMPRRVMQARSRPALTASMCSAATTTSVETAYQPPAMRNVRPPACMYRVASVSVHIDLLDCSSRVLSVLQPVDTHAVCPGCMLRCCPQVQ